MDNWEQLELSSDDPCRTAVYVSYAVDSDEKRVVFKTETDETGSRPVTKYTNAGGGVVATLEWRTFLGDKPTLCGGHGGILNGAKGAKARPVGKRLKSEVR